MNVKTKVAGNVSHDKLTSNMTLNEETDLTKLRKKVGWKDVFKKCFI